jgi:hypothetical protein
LLQANQPNISSNREGEGQRHVLLLLLLLLLLLGLGLSACQSAAGWRKQRLLHLLSALLPLTTLLTPAPCL